MWCGERRSLLIHDQPLHEGDGPLEGATSSSLKSGRRRAEVSFLRRRGRSRNFPPSAETRTQATLPSLASASRTTSPRSSRAAAIRVMVGGCTCRMPQLPEGHAPAPSITASADNIETPIPGIRLLPHPPGEAVDDEPSPAAMSVAVGEASAGSSAAWAIRSRWQLFHKANACQSIGRTALGRSVDARNARREHSPRETQIIEGRRPVAASVKMSAASASRCQMRARSPALAHRGRSTPDDQDPPFLFSLSRPDIARGPLNYREGWKMRSRARAGGPRPATRACPPPPPPP